MFEYKDAERDKEAVCAAIETISSFFVSDGVTKFLRRKAHYTPCFLLYFICNEKRSKLISITKTV